MREIRPLGTTLLTKTDVNEVGVFIGERLRARAVRPATGLRDF